MAQRKFKIHTQLPTIIFCLGFVRHDYSFYSLLFFYFFFVSTSRTYSSKIKFLRISTSCMHSRISIHTFVVIANLACTLYKHFLNRRYE